MYTTIHIPSSIKHFFSIAQLTIKQIPNSYSSFRSLSQFWPPNLWDQTHFTWMSVRQDDHAEITYYLIFVGDATRAPLKDCSCMIPGWFANFAKWLVSKCSLTSPTDFTQAVGCTGVTLATIIQHPNCFSSDQELHRIQVAFHPFPIPPLSRLFLCSDFVIPNIQVDRNEGHLP